MGNCLGGVKKFTINSDVEGQDQAAVEMFQNLGLEDNDVDRLFTAFSKIDIDGSGTVKPSELFSYFEIESTSFENGIFSMFDEDKSGLINFMEFVCSMWNFLTIPREDMGSLAYLIKDPSAVGCISCTDVKDIIEMMHRRKLDRDPSLMALYTGLRNNCQEGIVTMPDFAKWARANPSFSSPLMILQLHLRKHVIGESFWSNLSKKRKADPLMCKISFIKQLEKEILEKNRKFLERQEAEEKERRRMIRLGLGKTGDSRDNVTRKQSVLLGYFQLKDRDKKYRVVDLRQTMPDTSTVDKDAKDRDREDRDGSKEDSNDSDFINFSEDESGPHKSHPPRHGRSQRPSLYNLLRGVAAKPTATAAAAPKAPRKRGRSFYEALTAKSHSKPSSLPAIKETPAPSSSAAHPHPPLHHHAKKTAAPAAASASGPVPEKASQQQQAQQTNNNGNGKKKARRKSLVAALGGVPKDPSRIEPEKAS